MQISLIVAVADNGVIGKKGVMLPWHLSADLAHFKGVTMGHPIIMGSTTYKTIGRPLPGRKNIVITRDTSFNAEGCTVVHSIEEAFSAAEDADEAFVIGGGAIYEQTLPLATKLYITQVHAQPDGDVYFTYSKDAWREIHREDHVADEKNEYDYSFIELIRQS
jgi:dihydrofolate reductase